MLEYVATIHLAFSEFKLSMLEDDVIMLHFLKEVYEHFTCDDILKVKKDRWVGFAVNISSEARIIVGI
jgi:hypothetical protein